MENKRRTRPDPPKERTTPGKESPNQKEDIKKRIEELVAKMFEKPGKK